MYSYTSINDFMNDYKKKKIDFPYKRLYYTDKQIHDMFNKLKNLDLSDRIYNKYYTIKNVKINTNNLLFYQKPTILISKSSDYLDFSNLSDMFQEKNRMLCKFISAESSPMDYFHKHINNLCKDVFDKHKKINPHLLREQLYSNVKECSSFKTINMIYLVKLFKVKSVLDPSSGWGDRLIASLICDIRYVGVDPNYLLHPVYNEMINFLKPTNKITLIESKIQDAKLPNEKFDMIFTSPPYYKIEKYSNKGETTDKTEHDWFNNFMIPLINTYKKLNNNGHLVLVINQMPYETYIYKMLTYIRTIDDLYYIGVIGYADAKLSNPQPMWIWERSKNIPINLYNPPIEISKHIIDSIKYNVFRDDNLIGGTKQRALVTMINQICKKNKKIEKFIYAGPASGYAQIALAYCCYLTKKKAVIFTNTRTNLTKFAMSFTIELYEINGTLETISKKANEYYLKNKNNSYLIPFGLHDDLYKNNLIKNMKSALPSGINPKRIWIVAGSATILNVLYKIFPKTYFMVVQVGRTIWDDLLDKKRTTLFVSKERFNDIAIEQPPYPTVSTYDAKLWTFFKQHKQQDDYIWNVAKDVTI